MSYFGLAYGKKGGVDKFSSQRDWFISNSSALWRDNNGDFREMLRSIGLATQLRGNSNGHSIGIQPLPEIISMQKAQGKLSDGMLNYLSGSRKISNKKMLGIIKKGAPLSGLPNRDAPLKSAL